MKYSNGDMDDLFRRASERYPLRTDGADWDRLASDLDGGEPGPPGEEEKRRRRGAFWWFLLIPLAVVGYLTWQVRAHHSAERGVAVVSGAGHTGAVVPAGQTGGANSAGQTGAAGQDGGVASGGKVAQDGGVVSGGKVGQEGGVVSGGKVSQTGQAGNGSEGEKEVRTVRTRDNRGVNSGGPVGTGSGERGASMDGRIAGERVAGTDGGVAGGKGAAVTVAGTDGRVSDATHSLVLAALDLRRVRMDESYNVVVDVVAPVVVDSPAAGGKKPTKNNGHSRVSPRAYFGLLGAPDFSTVHYQSMKGVGTTYGVLLGYNLNNRWAVETGVYLDRKRYYTAGEYFNMSKVRTPPYSTLLDVNGTCDMLEIPINMRYNFNTDPKSRIKWFATAGLSTYLMFNEDYTYWYETNNWSVSNNFWHIHKPSQYWFSVVNLSAGFEQRLGKIGNLRLEPYVRLPLSGIGTGKLPILSSGLNIGFTHQLWK